MNELCLGVKLDDVDVSSDIIQALYEPWARRHHSAIGLKDRERRFPERQIRIARDLGVLPEPKRTICVTGSKGKGSVVRLLAWSLQQQGFRVGMVLSPEEKHHRDRIRINSQPIPSAAMRAAFDRLNPRLLSLMDQYPAPFYPAPSGLFLLLALIWFREQKVDYWVLEAGRGGGSDEIGQLDSAAAVVTSVFTEHLDTLGPDLDDVLREKLAIGDKAEKLFLSGQVASLEGSGEVCRTAKVVQAETSVSMAEALANAVLRYLGCESTADAMLLSPLTGFSFGSTRFQLLPWVHPDSADPRQLQADAVSVVGLSPDKLSNALLDKLRGQKGTFWLGARHACPSGLTPLADIGFQSCGDDLREALAPLMADYAHIDLIGNQQFMALARRALKQPLAGPG